MIDGPPLPRSRLDGRWIVAAMLLGYFVLLAARIPTRGYAGAWEPLGVPALSPSFADLRVITAGGDSYRAGYNPLVNNPADFWKRPMDYPRVWLLPMMAFGIHQADTVPLGVALAVAFVACTLVFMGRITPGQGVWWGFLLCAPSTMLAVERGNNDLVIFVLLVCALLLLRRGRAIASWVAFLAVGACAVLKLYPVFAFMLAWRETPRRALLILAVAAVAFGVYLHGTRDDLRALRTAVPRAWGVAYGSRVYFDWLAASDEPSGTALWELPVLAVVAGIGIAGFGRVRVPGPAPLARAEADGLMVGGALYLGTFILNSNFNYRLVVLLFTVPALLQLRGSREIFYRRLGTTLLVALAVGWWFSAVLLVEAFLIKELANWLVFVGMAFLLFQFVPLPTGSGVAGGLPVWRRAWREEAC